jgi:ATP-binding cassette, subfamily B, bacterial MsbA
MRNFLRALRFSWPYRYRLAVSVVCAGLAAAFWALNFTAIYPVLKILSSDQNLQEWVNDCIKQATKKVDDRQQDVARDTNRKAHLEKHPELPDRDRDLRRNAEDLAKSQTKLESASNELWHYHVAKRYIDAIFPEDRFQTLAFVILLVVAAIALKGFFEFWQETLVGSVVNRSLYDIRNRFYRRAIHLDVANFNDQGTHELMARFTNDVELLGTGQKMLFGKVVGEPLKAMACVIVACWISWQLTLMFMVLVPVALFILARVGRTMKRATRRLLERTSHIYKILQESFLGIRVVKAFTREPGERQRFRQATKEYYKRAMWVVKLDAMAGPIIEVLGVAAVALALLAGAYLVLNKQTHLFGMRMTAYPLEAESLLQLYALLAAVADPARKLSSVLTRVQSGAAAADRIFQYMDREPKIAANIGGPRLDRHRDSIEFREICFSYEPGHPILYGVSLTVRYGETIALVGKNGCGKSTLVNLLPRFYDPDHGSLLIDGVDIRSAHLRSLRQQIGMVTQDTILFDDTVYNNIAYGHRRTSREQVEAVAKLANAHDFILKLSLGYDTRLLEAGTKLSGGQKQRIALARALLRDPTILILDEFTSQSDALNEAEVHRLLREFRGKRTMFVITHRLNTLEIADRIVVLDGGRIVAMGQHQDLLRTCAIYQSLHEAHSQRLVA